MAITLIPDEPCGNAGIVLDAVRDMSGEDLYATREAIAEATGLKLSVVDDRTRFLVDNGFLLRLKRGAFKPLMTYRPARPMSKTILEDGWVKIEIGDDMLTLTPSESRKLAELTAGGLAVLTSIEAARQSAIVHADLARRMLVVERENRALRRSAADAPEPCQMVLLGER